MNKDEIIKQLRDMAKHPTVTLPRDCEALKAAADLLAQPEQEPVAWRYNGNLHEFDPKDWATGPVTPLYTAPPQRTWVGLTEDEAFACKGRDYFETYKAIEAKLKEKNT